MKSASGSISSAESYGSGSTKVNTIPSGQLFSGRLSGGGTRSDVFGSRFVSFSSHFLLTLISGVSDNMEVVILV